MARDPILKPAAFRAIRPPRAALYRHRSDCPDKLARPLADQNAVNERAVAQGGRAKPIFALHASARAVISA